MGCMRLKEMDLGWIYLQCVRNRLGSLDVSTENIITGSTNANSTNVGLLLYFTACKFCLPYFYVDIFCLEFLLPKCIL